MENSQKLIMLVDDSATNLKIGAAILAKNYKVLTARSAEAMLETLELNKPDLILLDVDMPEMSGFEAIGILKERPAMRDIPVIFLTAMNDSASELKGLELGAVDYITKPFSPPLLIKRVELHLLLEEQKDKLQNYNSKLKEMVRKRTKTVLKLQSKILEGMAELVESRDSATGNHIARTRKFLRILLIAAVKRGLLPADTSEKDIELFCQSCQLHDVGKIGISDHILKKPGKLTDEEFAEIKQHVDIGVGFIEKLEDGEKDSAFLRHAKTFAKYHHEKWDGTGYPRGISGEDIPLFGRLMAIVDVYDALTSDRPYKKAFSHEESVRIILDGSGTHFDPNLVGLFEQSAEQFRC